MVTSVEPTGNLLRGSMVHPHIEFASRYADRTTNTLNAFVALWRARVLVEDADDLEALLRKAGRREGISPRPWFGFEITSYYAVGLVTCLEWHARSRLVDLFTYKPSCITAADIKAQISQNVILPQMIAGNLPAAHILGAIRVNSVDRYLEIFDRIYKELGIVPPSAGILASLPDDGEDGPEEQRVSVGQEIKRLFEYRHALAHEIAFDKVASYSFRDNLDAAEAGRLGRLVASVIQTIEAQLTRSAPPDFPNLLDQDGIPKDETVRLKQEIEAYERDIAETLRRADAPGTGDDLVRWRRALDATREALEREVEFVRETQALYSREIDRQQPFLLHLYETRVSYLRRMKSELESFVQSEEGEVRP